MAKLWLSADSITAHLGVTKDGVCSWVIETAIPAPKAGCLRKFQAIRIDGQVRLDGRATRTRPMEA